MKVYVQRYETQVVVKKDEVAVPQVFFCYDTFVVYTKMTLKRGQAKTVNVSFSPAKETKREKLYIGMNNYNYAFMYNSVIDGYPIRIFTAESLIKALGLKRRNYKIKIGKATPVK